MKKVWLDPGHGGNDGGACALGRREKDDTLAYALELDRQFQAQGVDTVLTRTTDKTMTLTQRTNLENSEKCDLAIACHRNGASTSTATGLEIWLHSKAPKEYVDWAADICNGIKALGLPLRTGQTLYEKLVPGVYRGFRSNPNANYYANSGTNAPSMLIELGFISNAEDNAFFAEHYKEACAEIVRASCKYLGVPYTTESSEESTSDLKRQIAGLQDELRQEKVQQKGIKAKIVQDLLQLAAKYQP